MSDDLLLANLRTIGTHHCDNSVGMEAAEEIERLRGEVEREGRLREQTADDLARVLDRATNAENEVEALSEEVEVLAQEIERMRDDALAGVERLHDALDQFVAWELGQLDHPIPTRKEMLDMAMDALAGGRSDE